MARLIDQIRSWLVSSGNASDTYCRKLSHYQGVLQMIIIFKVKYGLNWTLLFDGLKTALWIIRYLAIRFAEYGSALGACTPSVLLSPDKLRWRLVENDVIAARIYSDVTFSSKHCFWRKSVKSNWTAPHLLLQCITTKVNVLQISE